MGSSKDVMELFAERDIRRFFSGYEGWKLAPLAMAPLPGRFYRVSRSRWAGEEVACVAVSFDPILKEEVISILETLPEGQGSRTRKYLLTPQATDTTVVPSHIRILLMDAFAFTNGNLVWLTRKKNAKKICMEPVVAS